ncbi:MAG: copper homeostasis protein CutC [Planctomycetes bacterium]|nr:copper homeostasis protein CutC [Planctomycetota bacterium]
MNGRAGICDFEICVDSFDAAIQAFHSGAARLELCADLAQDGLSPDSQLLDAVLQRVTIPVMVMVRPRPGDFLYSSAELLQMKEEIQTRRHSGCHGFVFGCLNASGMPDLNHCGQLLEAAASLPCTFHRAFDICKDQFEALSQLQQLGFTRILTSGNQQTAWQARSRLRQLIEHAKGGIQILPAGKVRADHARALQHYLGCTELHSSALRIACDAVAVSEPGDA